MHHPSTTIRGFSLIELMVGIVIAIIASIVMFQVFAFSERQKRATTGASDAQVNGALALDAIERETRMAGFGLFNSVLNDCNPATTYSYHDPGTGTGTSLGTLTQPIIITDGGTGPDTIRIAVSASDFAANYSPGQTCLRSTMPQPSSELNVNSVHGCGEGNLAVLVQATTFGGTAAGNCTIMEITQVQGTALKIQHNPGQGSGPSYNPPASYQNSNNWPAYGVSSGNCEAYLVCMATPVDALGTTFSINPATTGNLMSLELRRDGVAIAPAIMDLQAAYGVVPAGSSTGEPTWQPATGTWASSATLTKTQVQQIKAARIAVIARSGEFEKSFDANGICNTTTAQMIDDMDGWANFNTSAWPTDTTNPSNDWRCYRYKVFETVVPLRNAIWAAS
jgi:type IV pilus assembly protein PilW